MTGINFLPTAKEKIVWVKIFTLYELSPYHHHYHLTRNGLYEPHKWICILFQEFGTEMLHRF